MPVVVLSGFLGAGKTTFLNTLMHAEALAGSMVIVNEFGDVGLDGLFLEAQSAGHGEGLLIKELNSGCLCCTLQGPLVQTLEDLLRARDNGRIEPFRQLIIETTGLADPTPILGAFATHPYLSLRYLVGGIVTVVDAAQDPESLDGTPEATAQIAVADVLAISKRDLVDEVQYAKLAAAVHARNPAARQRLTSELANDTAWLSDLLAQAEGIQPRRHAAHQTAHHHDVTAHAPSGHSDDHHHNHDHGHGHHHHHHAFSTVVTSEAPLQSRTVQMFMELLGMNLPGQLLRVKGIAYFASESHPDDPAEPWAVHAAGPLQHPARPVSEAVAAKLPDTTSRIVVITRSDQTDKVQNLFAACLRGA